MPRYIDANKIEYEPRYGYDEWDVTKAEIEKIPTADVAPVIHAHWRYLPGVFSNEGRKGCVECSACKSTIDQEVYHRMYKCGQTRRCGACGAQMVEEGERCQLTISAEKQMNEINGRMIKIEEKEKYDVERSEENHTDY